MRRSRKPKVLCLGLSYADIEGQLSTLQKDEKDQIFRDCRDGSVKSVVHSVRRRLLSEMDGRDLARCISTERICGVDVYTVSQEKGAVYREDRHLDANFNRHDFVRNLRKKVGEDFCFDEIILDYFWIPQGWDAEHWSKSFFEKTLVAFAEENMLRERTGAIYLPFCLHCFKFVHICFDQLKRFFNVSFIRKNELKKVSLWRGTQEIDPREMQNFLGKKLSQEEIYCTFGQKDIAEAMEDSRVSKTELIKLAESLEDFHSIRFLCLKLLPGTRPALSKQACGSFIGCIDPRAVQRGFSYTEEDATTITRVGRNIVGRNALPPAASRRTIKAKSQTAGARRSLFSVKKQEKPNHVADSSNSNDQSIASMATRLNRVRVTIQTPVKITPESTPQKRKRSAKPANKSTLDNASHMNESSSDTPLATNNAAAHFSSGSPNPTNTPHRYPTRRLESLRKPSPAITPTGVVTPDLSDSSISSKNKRSRSESPEPSPLVPRDLFSPSSSPDATGRIRQCYFDVVFFEV